MFFPMPQFGETNCITTAQTAVSEASVLNDAAGDSFDAYCERCRALGFVLAEAYRSDARRFAAFRAPEGGVFLN